MLTVKDFLEIKAIEGIKIVAGHQGINNNISIVNIIENPDVFDWLNTGELLLSTGYIFKDSEELQNKVIHELAEINCAGLCIKMKRYFDKIPQNMIDLANSYGFPLLELPFQYTLSKVIAIINEKTNADYDALNRRSLDLYNSLFQITFEGGGLDTITTALADMIQNPVIILNRDWNLLHFTDHPNNPFPLDDFLPLTKNKPVFPTSFTDSIPNYVSEIKKSIKRFYEYDKKQIKCRIMPIAEVQNVYGYIVVVQTVRKLTEFDYVALEHVSTMLSLDRIKAKEIEEVKLKIRQDFFDDLLTGKITSTETLQTLSDLHGLKADYTYYCIVISIQPEQLESYVDIIHRRYELEHITKRCIDIIYDNELHAKGELTCYSRNNQIIVLVGRNEHRSAITVTEAKAFATEIANSLSHKIKNSTFRIGIGRQYQTIHTLHKSFADAHEALRLMQRFNEQKVVAHFEDYWVYHFLDSNIKASEMENFFTKCLGELYKHDMENGTSFIFTLENYFLHHQNSSAAAKAMFIHRNTFIYRIEKIKEILKTDLKNSEDLLQIQIALKIFRLLRKQL